jgi:hypothetical protein
VAATQASCPTAAPLETMDGTGLAEADKLRIIGLVSSYTLSAARMAHDAARAVAQAQAGATGPPAVWTFQALLRESTSRTIQGSTASPGAALVWRSVTSTKSSASGSRRSSTASRPSWTGSHPVHPAEGPRRRSVSTTRRYASQAFCDPLAVPHDDHAVLARKGSGE